MNLKKILAGALAGVMAVASSTVVSANTTVTDELDCPAWTVGHTDGVLITEEGIEISFKTKTYDGQLTDYFDEAHPNIATSEWHGPLYFAYTGTDKVWGNDNYKELFWARCDTYAYANGNNALFANQWGGDNLPEGFTWKTVGAPTSGDNMWADFIAANVAGTTGSLVAKRTDDVISIEFTVADVSSTVTFPVEVDEVYVSLGGDHCVLTDVELVEEEEKEEEEEDRAPLCDSILGDWDRGEGTYILTPNDPALVDVDLSGVNKIVANIYHVQAGNGWFNGYVIFQSDGSDYDNNWLQVQFTEPDNAANVDTDYIIEVDGELPVEADASKLSFAENGTFQTIYVGAPGALSGDSAVFGLQSIEFYADDEYIGLLDGDGFVAPENNEKEEDEPVDLGDLTVTTYFVEKTDFVELRDGGTLTFTFHNQSTGTANPDEGFEGLPANYENFVMAVVGKNKTAYNGFADEVLIFRADNFAFGGGLSDFANPWTATKGTIAPTYDTDIVWADWPAVSKAGFDVTVTLSRDGDTLTYKAQMGDYYDNITATSKIGLPDTSLYVFLTGENVVLSNIKVLVDNPPAEDDDDNSGSTGGSTSSGTTTTTPSTSTDDDTKPDGGKPDDVTPPPAPGDGNNGGAAGGNNDNPSTGVVIVLIPAAIAAAGVLISKKRK